MDSMDVRLMQATEKKDARRMYLHASLNYVWEAAVNQGWEQLSINCGVCSVSPTIDCVHKHWTPSSPTDFFLVIGSRATSEQVGIKTGRKWTAMHFALITGDQICAELTHLEGA